MRVCEHMRMQAQALVSVPVSACGGAAASARRRGGEPRSRAVVRSRSRAVVRSCGRARGQRSTGALEPQLPAHAECAPGAQLRRSPAPSARPCGDAGGRSDGAHAHLLDANVGRSRGTLVLGSGV